MQVTEAVMREIRDARGAHREPALIRVTPDALADFPDDDQATPFPEPAVADGVDLDRLPIVVGAEQATALAALLQYGRHHGTTIAYTNPPARIALFPLGDIVEPPGGPDALPRVHVLGVAADDGRLWQIPPAGICWPYRKGLSAVVYVPQDTSA